jgi:hypothetical protein
VPRRQHLPQRGQAVSQAFDAVGDRMEAAVGCLCTGMNSFCQLGGETVNLGEQVADYRASVLGTKRRLPFERAQKLLTDSMVVRMAERAQARGVQGLGLAVQSAQQRPMPMVRQKGIFSPRLAN